LDGEQDKTGATGDPTWILGKARLLQKFQFFNRLRNLWDAGHQNAPRADYAAIFFFFDSVFEFAGEENGSKIRLLE
jgi:hypothetical protein